MSEFNPATASDAEKVRESVKWFDMFDRLAEHLQLREADAEDVILVADLTRGTEIQQDLLRIADRLEELDGE